LSLLNLVLKTIFESSPFAESQFVLFKDSILSMTKNYLCSRKDLAFIATDTPKQLAKKYFFLLLVPF